MSTRRSRKVGREPRTLGRRLGVVLTVAWMVVAPAGISPAEVRDAALAPRRVRIVDYTFSPRVITIARGTRVRWTNADPAAHTATSVGGSWNSGTLLPGESYVRLFRRRGRFRYLCTIHPAMAGTVRVI
jgi:plastocyanin